MLLFFCLRYKNIFLNHFILTQHVDKQQESIVSSANMVYKNQSCWNFLKEMPTIEKVLVTTIDRQISL